MKASLMAMGDIYINREDPGTGLKPIRPLLAEADLVFGNLETPLTARGSAALGRLVPIRTPPDMVEGLKSAGIGIVAVANNHTTDYGADGLTDTFDLLDRKGVRYVGGGRNHQEAHSAAVLQAKGIAIGFLAYECTIWSFGAEARQALPGIAKINVSALLETPHIDEEDLEVMKQDIKRARERSDVVVVSFHWGVDLSATVAPHQKELARRSIEAGASVVLGHHPHRLQGIELYRGGLICYSLGNILFDTMFSFPQHTMIIETVLSAEGLKEARVHPILIQARNGGLFGPVPPGAEDSARIAGEIEHLSKRFGTRFARGAQSMQVLLD